MYVRRQVPLLAYRLFGLNATAASWFAYIVTHPLGASFADWAPVPASRAGLGLGAPCGRRRWGWDDPGLLMRDA
jgi:uncharacterized membrane-anchored protein